VNNLAATVAAAAGAFAVTIVDDGGRGSYKKVIATVIHVESGVTASTLLTEDPNPDQPLDRPPELLAGYVASGDSFLTGTPINSRSQARPRRRGSRRACALSQWSRALCGVRRLEHWSLLLRGRLLAQTEPEVR
jgi:hypothetical protein